MSSFGRFTPAIGGVVETLSYSSPTLTLTQSEGTTPLTATIPAGVSGSGTSTFFPKWNTATSLNNSLMYQSAIDGIGINTGASANRFLMTTDASIAKIFSFRSANLPRWALRVDGTESGSNAGADFAIRRYNDAGTFVDAPLSIQRSSGNIGLKVTPSNWSGYNALQNIGGTIIGSNGEYQFWQNAYFDGASKYYATGTATRYAMVGGQHRWYNAISGSANSAVTWVQAMTLDTNGGLSILAGLGLSNTTAPASGIQFPATQVASANNNNLDDYEEGTWTMGVTFGGGAVGVTFSANTGNYVKIGKQVTVTGYMLLTNKGTSTGTVSITGLPFTVAAAAANYSATPLVLSNITFLGTNGGYSNVGTSTVSLTQTTTAGATSALTDINFANNSSVIICLTYFV